MGSKGGSQKSTQTSEPWAAAQPYLVGDGTHQGVLPEAMALYGRGGWTPGMDAISADHGATLRGRMGQVQQYYDQANDVNNGAFDPNVQRVGNITGVGDITGQSAFSNLGSVDPTQALQQMLSGQANLSALNPVVNTALGRMSDNYLNTVMPAIRGNAIASGQYGGSRQGVAEGLASEALAQNMGDTVANMYNNAYNQAQQQMYGTASNLSGIGTDLSKFNTANDLNTQQFNANLGLQNNSQAMQQSRQNLDNRQAALNMMLSGNQLGDSLYLQQLGLNQQPNTYDWQNLNNYANIAMNGAKLGGTTTGTTTAKSSPLSTALGLGLTGLGIYNGFGGSGLSGMGLLGGGGYYNNDLAGAYATDWIG